VDQSGAMYVYGWQCSSHCSKGVRMNASDWRDRLKAECPCTCHPGAHRASPIFNGALHVSEGCCNCRIPYETAGRLGLLPHIIQVRYNEDRGIA
jgi:hypothetical protein